MILATADVAAGLGQNTLASVSGHSMVYIGAGLALQAFAEPQALHSGPNSLNPNCGCSGMAYLGCAVAHVFPF